MSSKKKSSAQSFEIGDTVLHKMRGYPAWPGIIVAHGTLSGAVLKEKPRQGTFHCVRYYPKGDHSWAAPRDLKALDHAAIDAYLNSGNKKAGELFQAYETAKDPSDWLARQEEALERQRRQIDGEDEIEQDDQEPHDEDEIEEDDNETGDKRKRPSKAAGKAPSSAKKSKTEKAKTAGSSKAKSSKVKSSANVESEEEDTKDAKSAPASSKAANGPAPTADGEADPDSIKVKEWRHKLQRAFLGKAPPQEKDMGNANEMFTTIEQYDKMTIEQLQISKIGKVMRKIAALPEIPREDEFNFKQRAHALIGKWQIQLASAGANEDGQTNGNNGTHEE